jgi:hypothetical protein
MNRYISTGKKILRHLDKLKKFQECKIIEPISLQIAPTSRCNLSCCFCSNVNRNKHEDLSIVDIKYFIASTFPLTVEWTGGGDPTQYEHIKEAILFANKLNLKQGFITNGIALVDKINDHIKYLDWIRISLNSLDYVDNILIPVNYKGILGFSYVINEKTTLETINKLKEYAVKYNPKYIRIVPNCQTSAEDLIEKNKVFSEEVNKWGHPFFYQEKIFSIPNRCWWGYFKPFLLHDGYIYPCSSVVLNDTAERSFHEKFRWKSMDKFIEDSKKVAIPYDCKECNNCVFGEQNNLVESVINPEMENFV